MGHHKIDAVSVNHNTSRYMELMLRSLYAHHPADLNLTMTVLDNASKDDTADLRAYTEKRNIPFLQSGFTTETKNNSHGELLGAFALEHPDCTHYLFLDSDVCFLKTGTIGAMLDELDGDDKAFGIGPKQSWDGVEEIPKAARDENPDICDARLHPCCALVKNTPLFRNVVAGIGLSSVNYLLAGSEKFDDTFKLATKVMGTHGLAHRLSQRMVLHFFCVSYYWEPAAQWTEAKAKRRDELLERYRTVEEN